MVVMRQQPRRSSVWVLLFIIGWSAALGACEYPLEVELTLRQTQYLADEPISGTITLHNRASHSVTAWFSSTCTFRVFVYRAGTDEIVQQKVSLCGQMIVEFEMEAGESVTLADGFFYDTSCSENSYFCEPLTPGRYRVEVSVSSKDHPTTTDSQIIEIVAE
jgi:hypothetical protein